MSGAKLIPAICYEGSAPGEKLLFRQFSLEAGCEGWTVLHSLDIARHLRQVSGESDFVVIIPGLGVVFLEVKSHGYIKYDERGWWLGTSTKPDPRGPFKQASEAMHSIRVYLQEKVPDLVERLPFVSGVVFTDFHFTQKSVEWHDWQLIDKQALTASSLAQRVSTMIQQAAAHYRTHGLRWVEGISLTRERAAEIALALRPRFEFFIKPADRVRQLKEGVLACTQQQLRLLDSFVDNDRLVVSGPAGTGKTCFAIESLRREKAARPGATVALFCYNKLLGVRLKQDCAGFGEGIRVGNLHGWMHELAGRPGEQIDSDYWPKLLPKRVADLLLETGPAVDLLILDEAQDLLTESYMDVFDLLLKGGLAGGRYVFLGDFERQNIFASGVNPLELLKLSSKAGFARFKIDINCRNSAEISHFVETLGKLRPGYSATLRGDTRFDPTLEFYGATEQLPQQLELTLRRLMAEGFQAHQIVVISPYADGAAAERLSRQGPWKGLMEQYSNNSRKIRWSTIQAFKGLEADAIILTDIDDLNSINRADLFYIGMSRALHRLAILAHEKTRNSIQAILTDS